MARRRRPTRTQRQQVNTSEMEKLLDTPEGLWRSARLLSSTVFGTMAPAITALIPKFYDEPEALAMGLPTQAVDRYYRCYVNNGFTEYMVKLAQTISPQNTCFTCGSSDHHDLAFLGGVICHEGQHPVRDHTKRARTINARHGLFNVAADLEINDDTLETFIAAHKEHQQLGLPYPQLCLPFHPELVVQLPNGEEKEMAFLTMNPLTIGTDPKQVDIVATNLPGIKPVHCTIQYDGITLDVSGVGKLTVGQTFMLGGVPVMFRHSKIMIPEVFRQPKYAKHGIDFPDDRIAEEYYYKLLDLRDKMEGEEQQQQGKKGKGQGQGKGEGKGQGQGEGEGEGEGEGQGEGEGKGSGKRKEENKGHGTSDGKDGKGDTTPNLHNQRLDGSTDMDNHGQNCGSGAHGGEEEYEEGDPSPGSPGISEGENDAIKREVAKNISTQQATRGNVPGGMVRWAEEVLRPPKHDWRKEFAKKVRRAVSRAFGHDQRTWRRLGRNSASTGYKLLYPSTFTPVPKIGIVLDTSGSMGGGSAGSALHDACSEVEGICKTVGANVVFCSVDMNASEIVEIHNFKDALKKNAMQGGGGTDMSVGVRLMAEMREPPQVCVVLTDGYTPWPSRKPVNMDVIAGLCGSAIDTNTPPWMGRVIIKDDE